MANNKRPYNRLNPIIGIALAVGVLCMCVSVRPAVAQQQGDQGAQEAAPAGTSAENVESSAALAPVIIIGSRIPRSSVETARPVLTLSAKQIQSTGLVNVGEILQHITSAGSAINSNVDVGGNGQTNLDMRNLGPNRVLVLVNGKRWITGLGGAVDLDQIPTSVIDSV